MRVYLVASLLFLINGCVTVPDTKVCAVAGVMKAGANCKNTLSNKSETMDEESFIDFLEPNEYKGPALCQSTEDWVKIKTALEQACKQLGPRCSYEHDLKKSILSINSLTQEVGHAQ